jgi:putative two-component system response regulator
LALELGAEDYVTKPFNAAIVLARVKAHLAVFEQNRVLEHMVDERTQELKENRLQIIQRLCKAAEFRDNETGFHVTRMSQYSSLIALSAGFSPGDAEMILLASPMHDIGKIGIPDAVLLKPGKLDPSEWSIMKQHAMIGAEIIGDHVDPLLVMAREIAASHHEKWDGSGYPLGLRGPEIPLVARIVAIADVFDALTSVRPYKECWSVAAAKKHVVDNSGSHFDPDLIPAFLSALPRILQIRCVYTERDESMSA